MRDRSARSRDGLRALQKSRQQIDLSIAKLDASLGAMSSGTARGSAAADLVRNEQESR